MFLVLGMSPSVSQAGPEDPSLSWAVSGLRDRGVRPIRYVSIEMLAASERWEFRVSETGRAVCRITLHDSTLIDWDEVRGTLNRLQHVPLEWSARAASVEDQAYAASELHAFFVSWIDSLPGTVLNRPSPNYLAGPYLTSLEWGALASRAGLHPARQEFTEDHFSTPAVMTHHVFVVGTEVIACDSAGYCEVADVIRIGCLKLASHVKASLLALHFVANSRGGPSWCFLKADPLPDLRIGGNRLLDAMGAVLLKGDPLQ